MIGGKPGMAIDGKKIGLHATAGVLIAFLIIASIMMSGLRLPTFIPHTGTLMIKLTDAPANITHLDVTIDNVSVHRKEGDAWVNLPFSDSNGLNVTVDLLALRNVTKDLCIEEIPAGNYTMIKLHIAAANATYADGDDPVELNVPSKTIKVIIHFEIESGELLIILIDMGVDLFAVSQSDNFRPVVKATVM